VSEKFLSELLAKLERIAAAQETTALMLQVLMEDAAGPPAPPADKVLMTQNGPVVYE
jgi:hypothetical protein